MAVLPGSSVRLINLFGLATTSLSLAESSLKTRPARPTLCCSASPAPIGTCPHDDDLPAVDRKLSRSVCSLSSHAPRANFASSRTHNPGRTMTSLIVTAPSPLSRYHPGGGEKP